MFIPNLGGLFAAATRRGDRLWNEVRERHQRRVEDRKAKDRAGRTYATALEHGRVYRTEAGLQLAARRQEGGLWLLTPYPSCFAFGDVQEYFVADDQGRVARGETGKDELAPQAWGVQDLIVTDEFDAE
jgi:hypothetical protein